MSDIAATDFAPDCQDKRCDDCRADDCVCGCHLADDGDDPWWWDE